MNRPTRFLFEMWVAVVANKRRLQRKLCAAPNGWDREATTRRSIAWSAAMGTVFRAAKTVGYSELGLRVLCELACMFLALLLVEYAILGRGSLASINPHPFWFPILLLSAQYGTASGLSAAVVAIALSWVVGWPPQQFGEDYYAYSLRIWHQPILWLCTAILLGELRYRHIGARNALSERLTEAEAQRQSIAQLCAQLQGHNQTLNRQIACAQDQSIGTALAALTALRGATPDTAGHALAAAVNILIGPAKFTVLVPLAGELVVLAELSATPGHRSQAERCIHPALRDAVLRDRRFLSVLRKDDVCILDGVGVLAGPILAGKSGTAQGVLLLEDVSAARLHDATETALRIICAELSQSPMTSEAFVLHHERAASGNGKSGVEDKMANERAVALRLTRPTGRRAGVHGL